MPFLRCPSGADNVAVRDIAVLTRVGRPTCFVVQALDTDEDGQPFYRLSRAEAQRMCKADYLDTLSPGDILPCTVTHIEPFGAFCDVGCGISALLPIDCMSVSRISSPADRVSVGQQILCAVKNRDVQGRFVLTIRELLGTWAENAAHFSVGETVVGIVRSVEEYGTFIEIAPNLARIREVLQLPDAVLVPREVLLLNVPCQLVAQLGVDGGVEQPRVLVGLEAVAELPDGAGVDKGPLEPAGREFGKLRVHGDSSFPGK